MRGLTDQERIQLGWAACSIAPEDRHTTQAEEAVGDMLKKRGLVILAPYVSPTFGNCTRYVITSTGRLVLNLDRVIRNEFTF